MYDIRFVGPGAVEVTGYEPGTTTVLMWLVDGSRQFFELKVVPAAPKSKPLAVPVTRTVERMTVNGVGQQVTLFTFPDTLQEITDSRETDGGIIITGRNSMGERLEVLITPP